MGCGRRLPTTGTDGCEHDRARDRPNAWGRDTGELEASEDMAVGARVSVGLASARRTDRMASYFAEDPSLRPGNVPGGPSGRHGHTGAASATPRLPRRRYGTRPAWGLHPDSVVAARRPGSRPTRRNFLRRGPGSDARAGFWLTCVWTSPARVRARGLGSPRCARGLRLVVGGFAVGWVGPVPGPVFLSAHSRGVRLVTKVRKAVR